MSSTIGHDIDPHGDDINPHVHLTVFIKQLDSKDPSNQIAYSMNFHDTFDTPGSV